MKKLNAEATSRTKKVDSRGARKMICTGCFSFRGKIGDSHISNGKP